MRNLLLMARHEYVRLARRRTFQLSTLGFPLMIAILIGIGFLIASLTDVRSLGYVDPGQRLDAGLLATLDLDASIQEYASEREADDALLQGQIDAYYVFPSEQRGDVRLVYEEEPPGSGAQEDFRRFVQVNLISELPSEVRTRLIEGPNLDIRSANGQRSLSEDNVLAFLLPIFASLLFVFAVMMSAGYLLQIVAEEKENRTIEMLVTSMRPETLISGKALGLIALVFTQLAIWGLSLWVAILVGGRIWPDMPPVSPPWLLLLLAFLFFVPSYALVTGFMTSIGSAVTDTQQGQQIAGMINLLFLVPLFILPIVLEDPAGPIAVGLTLFPTTSFIMVTLRWSVSTIPAWQLIVSWGVLTATAASGLWIAGRIFRAGMLRYGQPLSVRDAFNAVRSG